MATVTKQIVIEASTERVWEVLADFGGVSKWSPSVDHSVTISEAEQGAGCERSCAVPGIGDITEVATEWEEGRTLGVDVHGAPLIKAMHATLSLRAQGESTIVDAEARFTPKFGPLGALMALLIMKRKFGQTFELTLAGLKHYAETGQPLPEAHAAGAEA